jgi:hypothetical protein
MTKAEYIELTGEDPEDMFGPDWENIIAEQTLDDYKCSKNNCGNPISYGDGTCGDKH